MAATELLNKQIRAWSVLDDRDVFCCRCHNYSSCIILFSL